MNRIIAILAFALTLSATHASANDSKGEIKTFLLKDFKNAQLISTEVHKTFTKATFTMNNAIMTAFYSGSGELLAVTRNIVSTQLPINLLMTLKNDYSKYWITELFEINSKDQNCYYISLEDADTKLTLRSNGDSWEVYSTVKK